MTESHEEIDTMMSRLALGEGMPIVEFLVKILTFGSGVEFDKMMSRFGRSTEVPEKSLSAVLLLMAPNDGTLKSSW